MMPRPQQNNTENGSVNNSDNNSTEDSIHNNNTHGMNVNLGGNVNYQNANPRGNVNTGASGGRSGGAVGDQMSMRPRYGHHHGPGGDMGGAGGGGGPMFGGPMAMGAAAAMNDYSGLANQYNRAAAAGFGPFNPGAGGPGGMNMNPAMMNPALYMGGGAAGGMMNQSPQQAAAASMGMNFRPGDPGGAVAGAGGNAAPDPNNPQAEQEEELLLNILIARRQRQFCPPGAAGPVPNTSWADDFMRLREKTMSQQQQQDQMGGSASASGERMPYEGFPQGDANVSRRQQQQASRMSMGAGAGMGHVNNMNNMNNMNMAPQQRFLPDPSGIRHRGSGVGFQMGSPQGPWMGANAASMHSHPNHPGGGNDSAYAHGQQRQGTTMKTNAQVGTDVLERADRLMPVNMMHDARMAEQGPMGHNPYHNHFAGGQPFGNPLQEAPMGYGKMEGQGGQMMMDKHGKPHFFGGSPQKPPPNDEAQPPKKKKRLHKRKPADMPRRPLSAYNLFFSEERERIIKEIKGKSDEDGNEGEEKGSEEKEGEQEDGKPAALRRPLLPSEKKRRPHRKTHGLISFPLLAQKVGQRWKALPDDQRKYYQDLAQEDMKRQKKAMEEYYQKRSIVSANEAGARADP